MSHLSKAMRGADGHSQPCKWPCTGCGLLSFSAPKLSPKTWNAYGTGNDYSTFDDPEDFACPHRASPAEGKAQGWGHAGDLPAEPFLQPDRNFILFKLFLAW